MRNTLLFFISLILIIPAASQLSAHEVRPGYLEMSQTGQHTYGVLWKVPARGDLRLGLYVLLPDECQNISTPMSYLSSGAYIERWSVSCKDGLTDKSIAIEGLDSTFTDVLVRIEHSDDTTQVERLTPSSSSFIVESSPSSIQVAKTYLTLGVEHILLGIDHLLFVLALLIIVKGWKRLIGTITAFTVAHSITLAAATLGFVYVPQKPVEAAIALSIVFVASEIVHGIQGKPGLTESWPWVVAFIFGLLHGLGFAGALSEVGLPEASIPLALLFFNIGVEIGQLLFVALVVCALFVIQSFFKKQKGTVIGSYGFVQLQKGVAYVIGSVALYWVIERVYSFWL